MLYRKKSGSASEAAVPQDVKVNADSLKNTETQAPEAERPQTQNTKSGISGMIREHVWQKNFEVSCNIPGIATEERKE